MKKFYSEILVGLINISIVLIGIGYLTFKSSKESEKASFEKGYNKAMMDCKGDTINNQIINSN